MELFSSNTPSIDVKRYASELKSSGELGFFQEMMTQDAHCPEPDLNYQVACAEDLTAAMIRALDAALPDGAAFIVNSSGGKDSSLVCGAMVGYLLERKRKGLPMRRTIVAIADTASEFPEMQNRILAESAAINAFGEAQGIPLSCRVVRPPAKARLFVELIGNGKPVPKLFSGANKPGHAVASWCMNRVKRGVLDLMVKQLEAEIPYFAQCLGVRSSESARRAAHIREYAGELPFGLTTLGDEEGDDAKRIGFTPIVHWTDDMLRIWMANAAKNKSYLPWRAESASELMAIYRKAAGTDGEATECRLTVTKEGAVSDTCSDLSGARMGCSICMLSKNRSLQNMASRDKRYVWIKKLHAYIYRMHDQNERRRKLRDASGFDADSLFPKTATFEWRYLLLMLTFRAEMESGFPLLRQEEIGAIRELWRKAGVWLVDPEEAREDAIRWKATGRIHMGYQENAGYMRELGKSLGVTLPSNAFWIPAQEFDLKQGAELIHLLSVADGPVGESPVPAFSTWVFRDRRDTDKYIAMVSDLPGSIGGRTSNALLNGLVGAAWKCVGVRPSTEWEKRISDGRVFFYETSVSEDAKRAAKFMAGDKSSLDATVRTLENGLLMNGNADIDDELTAGLAQQQAASEVYGKLTAEEFDALADHTLAAIRFGDDLDDAVARRSREIQDTIGGRYDLLEADSADQTASKFRSGARRLAKETLDVQSIVPDFEAYREALSKILSLIRNGKTNAAFVAGLVYALRTADVDPEEGDRLLGEALTRATTPPRWECTEWQIRPAA